jgi:TnpA family transposase
MGGLGGLQLDELVEYWTVLRDELELIAGKRGPTKLGFALLLKFYTRHGRFPRGRSELSDDAIAFVARQVDVLAADLGFYEWSGRTIEFHRAQIRRHLGFRECGVADADKLVAWLANGIGQTERHPDRVRAELLARCRSERIEPPSQKRLDRILRSGLHGGEQALIRRVTTRLDVSVCARLTGLVDVTESDGSDDAAADGSLLATIRQAPGNVSLDTMLTEIEKLEAVRAVGLPADLFADVMPKIVSAWRARAAVESPSHLRSHPDALRRVLLAALVFEREREITDTLVDLLIATVHRIGARAEKRVTEELINAFKRVTGKENILFRVAEAALDRPDDPVRDVVFPAVTGGEQTLRELVKEHKTNGPLYRRTVQTTLRASYTRHYRRGLVRLLEVLDFRSSNDTHRPVIDALATITRHAGDGNTTYYPLGETIPAHRGVRGDWGELLHKTDKRGRQRTVRMVYEVATFQTLREQLRCKKIWVVGADRWRNPDADLPTDFAEHRVEHYRELRKPLDPDVFIDEVRAEMTCELAELERALPTLDWLAVSERSSGAIKLSPLAAQPEPSNLRRIKAEVHRRWGTAPLIDILKEACLQTGCLDTVTSVAAGTNLPADVLAQRLMLAIYSYGTNTGIKAAAAGRHGHSEAQIRYARNRYLNLEAARAIAVRIADATFAARSTRLWGTGPTAVASDSTHVRAFDQNIFAEWHSRYGGRGVLICWHIERKSMAVHSQLISCTASEVAAMVEGAIRHGTTMAVDANYVDTHGQSEIGFGITRLLGFDLLPRIKRINKVKLYRPYSGVSGAYPRLTPALTRPVRWDVVAEQYDQMIKYATAIRTGTASTEAIPRRFTRSASHPTYAAMLEVGRAQKTIVLEPGR